jgi:hypothetical protein
MSVRDSRIRRISLAWRAISEAWPDAPPEGSKLVSLVPVKNVQMDQALGFELGLERSSSIETRARTFDRGIETSDLR